MSWKIRQMTVEDAVTVRRLWTECGLSDEPEDSVEGLSEFLSAPTSAGFVADESGATIGAALCGSDGRYGYVHHLAVHTAKRGAGVGGALVDRCLAFLKNRHVVIMVRDTNDEGLAFWEAQQFRKVDGLSVLFTKRAERRV